MNKKTKVGYLVLTDILGLGHTIKAGTVYCERDKYVPGARGLFGYNANEYELVKSRADLDSSSVKKVVLNEKDIELLEEIVRVDREIVRKRDHIEEKIKNLSFSVISKVKKKSIKN